MDELPGLTSAQVRAAVRYYGAFTDEIDRRIALNNEDADEAEAAWLRTGRPGVKLLLDEQIV
jgi:hypothetical protein